MSEGAFLGAGILLAGLGAGFWLITHLMLRAVPRLQSQRLIQGIVQNPSQEMEQRDAMLLLSAGGRVDQINHRARALFHLGEHERPNLEKLARAIRPAEDFFALCASASQARLIVDGHAFDATSYPIQSGSELFTLVILRSIEQDSGLVSGKDRSPSSDLPFIAGLAKIFSASLDLDATLTAVIEVVQSQLPVDLVEIAIWEPELEQLLPYHLVGLAGSERRLEGTNERINLGVGFCGWIAREKQSLLLPDPAIVVKPRPEAGRCPESLPSFVGTPLISQGELVGVLSAGSLSQNGFCDKDLALLNFLAAPTAVAIQNARRFQDEMRRSAELGGLAQLSQGFSSARDPKSLFAKLVQSIVPLVKVEILGFLIYNENTRTLEGQEPIYGLPSQFVELYRIPVPVGSPAEQMLLDQDILITENAAESPEWEALGLEHLAQAASLRETVLVPLVVAGRMLGYLQASNHSEASRAFSQDEIHLLAIVANQAAPVIENASLVMQARQRAQRAEALRRIASLAASSANLDEIFLFVLQELARLTQADLAFIFQVDGVQGLLRLHQASVFGRPEKIPGVALSLPTDDPQFHFTVTGAQHAFSTRNVNEESAMIPFYLQLTQAWQIVSVAAVPLIVRDEGIGELWLCSRSLGAFDQGDVQVVATAASQLAGAVERSVLSAQTDEALRHRVEKLAALARVSRDLSLPINLHTLPGVIYEEALRITGAKCGAVLLFYRNADEEKPVIRFSAGDPHPLELIKRVLFAVRQGQNSRLNDLSQHDYGLPHEDISSLLAVPIRYQNRPVGLIILHSNLPDFFGEEDSEFIQSLAAQAGVVLENAYMMEEKQDQARLVERHQVLADQFSTLVQSLRAQHTLPEGLLQIATAIRSVTPFQVVVISQCDPVDQVLHREVGQGLGLEAWEELSARSQPWEVIQPLLKDEFRCGSAYYLPAGSIPDIVERVDSLAVLPDSEERNPDSWHRDDLFLSPLYDSNGRPIGLISLDAPSDGKKPDPGTCEALEILSGLASLLIENWQKITTRDTLLRNVESVKNRLQEAADQSRAQLPLLLHRELDHTLVIQSLSRQLERIRSGLKITEVANQQHDAQAVLYSMAGDLMVSLGMQVALVACKDSNGIRLLKVIGSIQATAIPEVLFGQRNPLRQVLQDGILRLVADIGESDEWQSIPLLNSMGGRSFLALPVEIAADQRAGILVIGENPLPPFTPEDHQTYEQLTRQVSLRVQNINLLEETRRRLHEMDLLLDFARKIGLLDPDGILNALIETSLAALSNGDAGWIAIWQEEDQALQVKAARGYTSDASMTSIRYLDDPSRQVELLPLRVLRSRQVVRAEVAFVQDYNLPSSDLLSYRKATGGRLPVSTLAVPISRGGQILGVMVVDNFNLSSAFSSEDEALLISLAQQAALGLENARLFVSAEQRAAQLQALNQAAGSLTSSLQSSDLIDTLLDQLSKVLPFDTGVLWLRDGDHLKLSSASGFSDNESRIGISVSVQESALFQEMIATGRPVYVPDVRKDERFPGLIEPDALSWLGIPLIAKAELVGVIALEKREPHFYHPDQLQSASTFASQAGVALENARLFEESLQRAAELDQRSQRLALLNRLSIDLVTSLDQNKILSFVCQQIREAFEVDRVSVFSLEPLGELCVCIENPPGPAALPLVLPSVKLVERLRESLGVFSSMDVNEESELESLRQLYFEPRAIHSVLMVPLVTAVSLHGWLVIQSSVPYRFTPSEIDLVRTMTNQVAMALQNARLYEETRQLTQDLEQRISERTDELRREHNNTQTLLRVITELSSSLDLDLVMNRALGKLNDDLGAEQSLILLKQGGVYQAGLNLVQTSRLDQNALNNPIAEIAQWVTGRHVSALIYDAAVDTRWQFQSDAPPSFRSAIAVPLVLGEEVMGVLFMLHSKPDLFQIEQVSLIEATARQFSISLNNAELFKLIRDQSENLGVMLREQQIEASRSRAILESVTDGVLVTDASMRIILLNASAERILNLKAGEALQKPLDTLAGLLGNAGQEWRETIQRWTQAPHSYLEETYFKQINLASGQVVAVDSAPVFFRGQFLATVSIFRDITREVQVDRLKSEFVANVSHELRTPMTSIKGYVEIMLMGAAGPLNSQQKHFLEIVKSNTERLNILVNDLLDVSRIEAGVVILSLQELDLKELAVEILAEIQHRSRQEKKAITFILDVSDDLPKVIGDSVRIRQILFHLISNAFNYTPAEGQVVVRMRPLANEVQVDIQDNGIGIELKDQPRIFERFFRGEDPLVLATAGTGLGLAISKILVEMHKGKIWFFSSGVRGEGSVFSFTLPFAEGEVMNG